MGCAESFPSNVASTLKGTGSSCLLGRSGCLSHVKSRACNSITKVTNSSGAIFLGKTKNIYVSAKLVPILSALLSVIICS